LEYQTKALAMHRRFGNIRNEMLALFYIGWTYKDMRQPADALPYLHSAVQMADSLKMHSQLQNAFSLLSETYSSLGLFGDATLAMRRYAGIKDSLYVAERAAQMSAMETLYKTNDKDKEIRVLQMEKEEETRRRTLYGAGLAIVVVFAGVLVWLNRQKTSANEEILRQKNILEEQAREIELANAKLNETNLQLEHLNNEKNEFLGIVAHDLKSPLSGIMASAGLMRKFGERMSESDRIKGLISIEQTSRRMSDIISNLLDTNALESGKLHIVWQVFNLATLTEETLEHYRERASSKNITLHFSSASTTNTAFADPNATTQILDNLISNAVKYSPIGKSIYVRIRDSSFATIDHSPDDTAKTGPSNNQQPSIRLEIQDEGQGISDEDMSKLFGKFTRLSARPTGGEHSTGLGLSIVKKMVEAMNGKVWCESELGKGATFILELPKAV
jgi:signal transduction histidine kinase